MVSTSSQGRKRRTSSLSTQLSRPITLQWPFTPHSQVSSTDPVQSRQRMQRAPSISSFFDIGSPPPDDGPIETELPGRGSVGDKNIIQSVRKAPPGPSLEAPIPGTGSQWQGHQLGSDDEFDAWAAGNRGDDAESEEWQPASSSSSDTDDSLSQDQDHLADLGRDDDDDEADEEDGDIWKTSEHLIKMMLLNEVGCGPEQHTEHHAQHLDDCDDSNHYPLSATYELSDSRGMVRTKAFSHESIGLAARTFPTPREEVRSRFAEAQLLREVTAGEQKGTTERKQICIHNEYQPSTTPVKEFDVDSVLVFPHSLSAIRKTVHIQFTKQTTFNIEANLHMTKRVSITGRDGKKRSRLRALRQIPHLYLGTIDGMHHGTLFAFFPHLTRPLGKKRSSTWLTDDEAERFFDHGLLPACRDSASDGTSSRLVPSFQIAGDKARAKGYEQQTGVGERGLQQHKTYICQPESLSTIWDRLLFNIANPDNRLSQFEDLFLFVNTKNIKAKYKAESAYESLSRFWDSLGEIFDTDLIDSAFDVGVDVTPPQIRSGQPTAAEPVTFLWKACCLEREQQKLVTGPLNGVASGFQIYHNCHLRDATCMTLEVPRRSSVRRGGWVYAQWYNVVKEISDANKVFPFQHEGIADLAIDSGIYKASTNGKPWQAVVNSYLASKRRVSRSYGEHRATSFGVRFEVRFMQVCFVVMLDALTRHAHPMGRLPSNPDYVWAIATGVWTEFVAGNYEKLTALVEMAILTSPRTGVELSVSRLLYVLLLCLQNFENADVRRHRVLRYGELQMGEVTHHGLDLEANIQKYGFGWHAGIIDWERFTFREDVATKVLGTSKALGQFYKPSGRLIQSTKDVVDVCFQYLHSCRPGTPQERKTLHLLSHFVIRQYRRDVLDRLCALKEVREDWRSEEAKDKVQFCFDGLTEALVDKPKLMAGGRSACKTPQTLFEWLMGDSKAHKRTIMDGSAHGGTMAAWRTMLARVKMVTETKPGLHTRWMQVLQGEFQRFMWLVPYPNAQNGSYLQTRSHQGGRGFWSADLNHSGQWIWGEKRARLGRPEAWPGLLDQTSSEIRIYLGHMGTDSGRGQ